MNAKLRLLALPAALGVGCAAAPPPEVWAIVHGDGPAAPVLGIPSGRTVRVFHVGREAAPALRDAWRR